MNIRVNSYIIRGIAMEGTGVIPPPPVHSCLKNQMATKRTIWSNHGHPPPTPEILAKPLIM